MGTRNALLGAALALLLGAASSAQATTIVLASCVTGDCADLPADYAVRLTLSDVTYDFGQGEVPSLQIDVRPTTTTGAGDLSSVYLSFTGSVAAAPWVLAGATGSAATGSLVRFPRRGGTAPGSFSYDVELDFQPPAGKGSGLIHPGDAVRFTIGGLSADAFESALAHIQRIGPDAEGSAHVSVPDPVSSLTVFGLGLVAIVLASWRMRHRRGRLGAGEWSALPRLLGSDASAPHAR